MLEFLYFHLEKHVESDFGLLEGLICLFNFFLWNIYK